jgi:VIT1/CCC1 family predicted Fe2+/Mn2+ transporter
VAELDELAALYEAKGLTPATARTVAEELTDHDAFAAHVDAELRLDPEELTSPWQAALSSAVSFTIGAILPLLAILLPPPSIRVPVTFVAVLIALAITGWLSARLGGANPRRAIYRVVIGGALAMGITFGIGDLVGGAVG